MKSCGGTQIIGRDDDSIEPAGNSQRAVLLTDESYVKKFLICNVNITGPIQAANQLTTLITVVLAKLTVT
jgi:hypothetical protein